MASNLADCSGQDRTSLSFFPLCSSSEFLTFTGSVLTELSDVLYRNKNAADAVAAVSSIVPDYSSNTCVDCLGLFLSTFYNSDGRNQCISGPNGAACSAALSSSKSAFDNCSGKSLVLPFPSTACSNEQWTSLLNSGLVSDLAGSFITSDPASAKSIFDSTLALTLPEGLTFPCINYCIEDLITSVINLGEGPLLTCSSDIYSTECLNAIKGPVTVYSACSNQDLNAVLAAGSSPTSGSVVSTGQISLPIIVTSFAILVSLL
jgi:hypothetical protein